MNTKKQNKWWMWLIFGIALLIIRGSLSSGAFLGDLLSIFGVCFIIASIVEGVRGPKKKQELEIMDHHSITYCSGCGTKQESTVKFCSKCGKNNNMSK